MEEKYYIIDNANQYYVILKCTKQNLSDYECFGQNICLTQEGALDLFKVSEWFINRKIKHTVIFGKIDNPILKSWIKRDIDIILTKALNNKLLIPNEEIENLMMMSTEKRKELFWQT